MFTTYEQISTILTDQSNLIFLFPPIKIVEQKWGKVEKIFKFKVFLSHSSKDKHIVENIFHDLQKEEIKVWFDKIEIKPGDSITDKLNEGLANSDLGLLCFSKSFLNSSWSKAEMNYFFHQRMVTGKKNFIIINLDLNISEFPPLFQDYRYVNIQSNNWIQEIVTAIKELERDTRK